MSKEGSGSLRKDKNTPLLRHQSSCFLIRGLKEMHRYHLAKPTKHTFILKLGQLVIEHQKSFNNPRKILFIKRPQTSGVRDDTNGQRERNCSLATDIPFPFAQERQTIKHYRLLTKSLVKRMYCLKHWQ